MEGFAKMPDALLRVERVSKSFGAVVALQDASLHLPTGEITGLVGDNGAGKSTLIKIISGVLTPDSGSIEFQGKPAISPRPRRLASKESKPSIRTSRSPETSPCGRTCISAVN